MPDPITPDPNVQDWKTALPEDIRGNESLASLKDVGELAKGYLDLNTKIATVAVAPESAAKYELVAPPLPEGVTSEESKKAVTEQIEKDLGEIREMAFKAKMSQDQVKVLVEHYGAELAASHKAQADAYKAEMDKLGTEWGKDSAAKMDLAEKTATKLGAPAWMLSHPDGLRFFAKLGPKFAEDGTVDGKAPDGSPNRDAKLNPASILYPDAN
jgi:hypothetical protein